MVLRAFIWDTLSPLSNGILRPPSAGVNRPGVLSSSVPTERGIRAFAFPIERGGQTSDAARRLASAVERICAYRRYFNSGPWCVSLSRCFCWPAKES